MVGAGQGVMEGVLVALDDQDEVRLFVFRQESGVLALGMQGVGGHGAAFKGKRGEDLRELGDLVGFVRDRRLGNDDTREAQEGGKKSHGLRKGSRAALEDLAVDGDRLGGRGPREEPFAEDPLEGHDVEVAERAVDRGPGGRNKALPGGRAETAEAREEVLIPMERLGPFAEGPNVGIAAKDAGNDDLENDEEGMANPSLLARVRQRGEPVPKSSDPFEGEGVERDGHTRFSCETRVVVRTAKKGEGVP